MAKHSYANSVKEGDRNAFPPRASEKVSSSAPIRDVGKNSTSPP